MDQTEQTISGETKPVECPVAETKTECVPAVTQSVQVEAKTEAVAANPDDIQPEEKEARQNDYVPVVVRKEPGGGSTFSFY